MRSLTRTLGYAAVVVALGTSFGYAETLKSTPKEPGASIVNMSSVKIDTVAAIVRSRGYTCDSISSALPFIMGGGYYLYCNRYRYSYEIADKGGNWVVTVK